YPTLFRCTRHGAASGRATNSPEARKNNGMRIDASAVLAATTAGGTSPEVCRNDTAWWATTSRIDVPLAASTQASRDESSAGSKDSGELCLADIVRRRMSSRALPHNR